MNGITIYDGTLVEGKSYQGLTTKAVHFLIQLEWSISGAVGN